MSEVIINDERNSLFTDIGWKTLFSRYLHPDEVSPQQAFKRASEAYSDTPEMANRIYEYASRHWFMFATPILSNGGLDRGLPISCNLNYVGDSREGLCKHYEENAWLSTVGAGIGGYWGEVRPDESPVGGDSKSTGTIPFLKVVDSEMLAFQQGKVRRGNYAAYQDIHHPEIREFINIRKPTGGDINRKCLNLHHAVNITDDFMKIIEECQNNPEADPSFPLIDPNTKEITEWVDARELWQQLLETRMETGEPYLHFIDQSNRYLNAFQKSKGLRVHSSNLCSEIVLPTGPDHLGSNRTAVCCLSSVNLAKFDEWKNNIQFIPDLIRFLDNVIEAYINEAPEELADAVYSAKMERSIGLGAMGFHTYLQSHGIPWESERAVEVNKEIFQWIHRQALASSQRLAYQRGEPEDIKGSGQRNAHLLAIAPNGSSSLICGNVSPSVEPIHSNAYMHKTGDGAFFIRNHALTELLEKKGLNNADVWQEIVEEGGSIQNLDYFTDEEKEVFKTAKEIDQRWVVAHAADRQRYIDQAQSLNLFFPYGVSRKEFHDVHFLAWKWGLKTLYYVRSEAATRGDDSSRVERKRIEEEMPTDTEDEGECLVCQG